MSKNVTATAATEESVEDADGASSAAAEEAAAARLADLVSDEAIDQILADAEESDTPLDGPDGVLNQLNKKVIERALGAELDDHLGYLAGDPAGNGSGNSRNGFTAKR